MKHRSVPSRAAPARRRTRRSVPPLALSLTATTGREHLPWLRRHLLRAHALLDTDLRELSVALVGDVLMSRLHEQFLQKSGPTDVLTFPLEEAAPGCVTSGEVIICVPEARRAARARNTTPRQELLLYALHGMLHLTGYDDLTEDAYRQMHQMEDDILSQLGVGPVFDTRHRQTTQQESVDSHRRPRRNGAR